MLLSCTGMFCTLPHMGLINMRIAMQADAVHWFSPWLVTHQDHDPADTHWRLFGKTLSAVVPPFHLDCSSVRAPELLQDGVDAAQRR